MARPRRYETEAEKQKAYRDRQKGTGQFPQARAEQETAPIEIPPDPSLEAELVEQQAREQFGYSPSETRTEAERHAAAERMLVEDEQFSLPADIERVWGQGKRDSSGHLAAPTARYLISEWGLERFRSSQLHRAALGELEKTRSAPIPRG